MKRHARGASYSARERAIGEKRHVARVSSRVERRHRSVVVVVARGTREGDVARARA